ncbi:hypothetical protein [Streptomyces sp. NPDC054834]
MTVQDLIKDITVADLPTFARCIPSPADFLLTQTVFAKVWESPSGYCAGASVYGIRPYPDDCRLDRLTHSSRCAAGTGLRYPAASQDHTTSGGRS